MLLRLLIGASLVGAATAAVAQAAPREPTAKWTVDFDAAQCVASRAYGTAENSLHLILKAPPVGNVMQIAVMRTGGAMKAQQVDATIVTDQLPPRKTSLLMFGPRSTKVRAYVVNMPSEQFLQVRSAKTLTIRSVGLNETFSLSNMEPLLRTIDRCVQDLRRVWNVSDPGGEQSLLPIRAKGSLHGLIKGGDYPAVAANASQGGMVRVALLINETGKVADCTVIETSGVPSLDAQTCAVLRERAKYEPAAGADGKPAKDATIASIRWALRERAVPLPF